MPRSLLPAPRFPIFVMAALRLPPPLHKVASVPPPRDRWRAGDHRQDADATSALRGKSFKFLSLQALSIPPFRLPAFRSSVVQVQNIGNGIGSKHG